VATSAATWLSQIRCAIRARVPRTLDDMHWRAAMAGTYVSSTASPELLILEDLGPLTSQQGRDLLENRRRSPRPRLQDRNQSAHRRHEAIVDPTPMPCSTASRTAFSLDGETPCKPPASVLKLDNNTAK
jgi:hypothetical protein